MDYSEILVNEIKRKVEIDDNLTHAFKEIPRENFVYSGISKALIYSDQAIPTYYGKNFLSTSSQPSLMALFFKSVNLKEGDTVFEIGTGTGYNAAIMSRIIGDKGFLVTTEPEYEIFELAKENLKKYKNVLVLNIDGYYGYDMKKFDAIISTVAIDGIPKKWVMQLKEHGKIIAPIVLGDDITDYTFLFEKKDNDIYAKFIVRTSFLRALGKLSFKKHIECKYFDFTINKRLDISEKVFEFCITYFNSYNKCINILDEYGIYKNGILKFNGEKLINIIDNLKNVDLYSAKFKGVEIYDFLNFIPWSD
jgi:protein-L-isoaspartate(D-aspartate) O-methyltransferase